MIAEYVWLKDVSIAEINTYAQQDYQLLWYITGVEPKITVILGKNIYTNITSGSVIIVGEESQEMIKNAETNSQFLVDKTISYGDLLVITFLTIFLVLSITKALIGFFIPKFINFKR